MKTLLTVACLTAAIALGATGDQDRVFEVLLTTTTATELPANVSWRGRLIQNRGPNEISCTSGPQADAGSGAVATKSLGIVAGQTLYWPGGGDRFFCITVTANQLTGAATIVSGVP